jgi:hypothetical protein
MRAILSAVVLVVAARPAIAEESWSPISVQGIEYEVRLPLAQDGLQTYRMPPGRLEQTLARLGRRVGRLATDLEGSNLPSDIVGAPDRIFGQVAAAARAMGPDLVFSNPPRLQDSIANFSFNDGEQLISFAVSSPESDNISQQVDVVYRKRVAGEWAVDRRQTLLLERNDRTFGSPWQHAWYSESLGDVPSRRRTVVQLEYSAMRKRGHWLGSELRRGQRGQRFLLRTLDLRSGEPVVTQVPRQVVNRRGRATLLRSRDWVDRTVLRQVGVTFVRGTAGRKPHLRRLPARQPRARR